MSTNSKVRELIPKPLTKEQFSDIWDKLENKEFEKITIDSSKEFLVIERQTRIDEESSTLESAVHAAVRLADMEEYSSDGEEETAYEQLFKMIRIVEEEGFEPSYILSGSKANLQASLNIRLPRNNPKVFGIPVVYTGDIPAEVIILCGSPWKDTDPKDIKFSVKGNL